MGIRIEHIEIISFGKLHNFVLDLHDGINLISAPNESGKSTVAAFIKFVLYGYSDGRKQSLSENDKKLFTPWDNPISEGSLILNSDGRKFRVFRSSLQTKEQVEVADVATGKKVYEGQEPGIAFFGISEEVFSRTLFFRQLTLPQGKDTVLADQLQNLAVSQEEQISSKAAIDRISKAKNGLKGRGSGNGIIPKLEHELALLEGKLGSAEEDSRNAAVLRADLQKLHTQMEDNQNRQKEILSEKENLKRWDARERLLRLLELKKDAEAAESAFAESAAKIESHGDNDHLFLSSLIEKNTNLEKKKIDIQKEEMNLQSLRDEYQKMSGGIGREKGDEISRKLRISKIGTIVLAIAAVLLLIGGIILSGTNQTLGICLLVAAFLACCGIGVLLFLKSNTVRQCGAKDAAELNEMIYKIPELEVAKQNLSQKIEQTEASIRTMQDEEQQLSDDIASGISSYRVELGPDFSDQLQELVRISDEVSGLRIRRDTAQSAYEKAISGVNLEEMAALAENAKAPERSSELVEREDMFLTKQQEGLSMQERDKSIKLATLDAKTDDPAVLKGKREAVEERLQECRAKYKAYEDAMAGIEEASDLMKSMIAPQISTLSGKYFAAATDNKYQTLGVDTRMSMSTDDNGISHECDYLSAGTRDCAYLAVRLALTDMLFKGNGVPIVLDDAFGRLDDGRLRATMRVLGEAADRHQILLLTCCDREEKALQENEIKFERIEGF